MGKNVTKAQGKAGAAQKKRELYRRILGIVLVAAAAALVIVGVVLFQQGKKAEETAPDASSYEEVMKNYYEAIMASDGKTMAQIMAPPEYWTYYMEEYDKTEEDVIASFAEGCSNTLQAWRSEYGNDVQVTYQIKGMSEQGEEGLAEWNQNMEKMLGNSGAEVEEAVMLEVDLTYTGGGKSARDVVYPTLGKIGDSWYILEEDNEEMKGN